MSLFITSFSTIAFKIESTPGVAETITANDMNLKVTEATCEPELPFASMRHAEGGYFRRPSVKGTDGVKFTFRIPIYAEDAITVPNYSKCLRCCSMKYTNYPGTGNKWELHSEYGNVTATISMYLKKEGTSPNYMLIRGKGCAGTIKIEAANVGEPAYMMFEFTGVLDTIEDVAYASRIEPSGIVDVNPDAFLSVGVTMFGEGVCLNTISFDTQNQVQRYVCPSSASGFVAAHIVDAHPMVTFDADLTLLATNNHYSRMRNSTTGAFQMQIGNYLTFNMPKGQITEGYKFGDRNGHVTNNFKLEGMYDSAGEQPFYILQGATS